MDILDRIQAFQEYANITAVLAALAIGFSLIWMYLNGRHLKLSAFYLLLTLFSGFYIPIVHLASTFLRWFLLALFTLRKRYNWAHLGRPAQLLLLFSIFSILSTLWSPNPVFGFQTAVLRILMVIGMGGMIAYAVKSPHDIRRLVRMFLPAIGIWIIANMIGFRDFVGGARFQGSTSHAALFVINGGAAYLILLWIYLTEERPVLKYSAALLMVSDLFLILISGQRTGTYAGIIASVVFFMSGTFRSRLKMGMMLGAGIAAVFIIISLNPSQSWFLRQRYGSLDTSGRDEIFQTNMEKALRHPWFGHGAGSETENYEIRLERREYRHRQVIFHNAFVEAFYQTGLTGLLLFAGALFLFLWQSALLTFRLPNGELRQLAQLLFAFSIYIILTALFEQIIISPSMILTYILVISSTFLHHIDEWAQDIDEEIPEYVAPNIIPYRGRA